MNYSRFILLFLLLFQKAVWSQNTVAMSYTNTPLNEVIIELEKAFDVKFSFDSKLIEHKTFSFNDDQAILQQLILDIENQTNVVFEQVSERYYIIKQATAIDLSKIQGLEEVVLKEYVTAGIKKTRDGSIAISTKKLGMLPGLTEPDVLQSLQLLPGVQSPSETASGLYIRGGTPDQNLILWDGIKMYHSGHFFGMISAFNPYVTEGVKLYTNGTKARYGNRIASVIDITSTSKIPNKIKGGLGFNMTHADAFLEAPIGEKFAFIMSARRSYKDVANTFTFKNFSNRVFQNTRISEGNKVFEEDYVTNTKDFFRFSDVTLKAIFKPTDKDEVIASSLLTSNRLDYGFLIPEFDETSTNRLDIKNKGLNLIWNHEYGPKLKHKIQANYSEYELGFLETNSYNNTLEDKTIKKNSIENLGFSFHTDLTINANNSLAMGYELASNTVDFEVSYNAKEQVDDFSNAIDEANTLHALYTEYEFKKDNRWFFNLGLRANHAVLLNKTYVEPRAVFEAKISDAFKLKCSAEQLHQTISQIVEFNTQSFGLENQIWAQSDGEQIPLLKSNQLAIGANYAQNGWNLDLDFYKKNITGLSSSSEGFVNQDTPIFTNGKSNILGVDMLVKKKVNSYRTWLSYTALKNDYKFKDINNNEAFPGNYHIAHQVNWSHSYQWNHFNFALGWSFRSGTPYTKATGIIENEAESYIAYQKINNERLPNYHKLDFSSTYKFNVSKNEKWKGKIGLSLLNAYNSKNLLSRYYKIRESQALDNENETVLSLQRVDQMALGITPNLVFRLEF